MHKKFSYNLLYRVCAGVLIILHLITFGPIRDAFAFTASSTSYKLFSGTLNEGGKERGSPLTASLQDSIAEPVIGIVTSQSFILEAGLIPTLQSNPPALTQDIPYQHWPINTSKENAFDLDDYFLSPDGYPLTFTVTGNSNIKVTIDPATHIVSFSQPQDWLGVEKVYFKATDDIEDNSTKSNEVVLQVANSEGEPNQPVIISLKVSPLPTKEGDLVKLTVQATDLDTQSLSFSYSSALFTQSQPYQEGNYWISEATWQTSQNSKGHYPVTVTVSDGVLTDNSSVLINIGNFNHPPVLESIDITPNTPKEGDLVILSPKYSDSDNDPPSFYYSSPFDSQGRWQTDFDDAGTYTIHVIASDGIDTVSRDVTLTINNTNQSPQANLVLTKYTLVRNEETQIRLTNLDPDKEPVTYTIKKDSVEIASGSLEYNQETPSISTSFSDIGDHAISATVTDSGGLAKTLSASVDVTGPDTNVNSIMGDFNGDGLTDLGIQTYTDGKWEIALSIKGTFTAAKDWLISFGTSIEWWPIGGDFNGDSKSDIAIYNPGSGNDKGQLKIAYSNTTKFSGSSSNPALTFSDASYSWQPFTGNFNGDKYTDFAVYNKETGEVRVALGTKSGFGNFSPWAQGLGTDYTAMSADFNADSLGDLCLFKKSTGEVKIAFSNTKKFVDLESWPINGISLTNKDILLSDFNNDGLIDIGYWDKQNSTWYYAISKSKTFEGKGVWLTDFGASNDESATTGDFDGNGITDAATFDKEKLGIERWNTKLSTNNPPDLLTKVDNGIGASTQVTYDFISGHADLPFPVYVAKSISLVNDFPEDRKATYTQEFSYSDGYFDSAEREFRGFAKVTATDLNNPLGHNYTETYFYQGRFTSTDPLEKEGALKGQIKKIIAYDGSTGRPISQTENEYTVKKAGPQDNFLGFPALTKQTTTAWEENGTYIKTESKFTYDNIGNPIEERSQGDSSKTGDEKSTATTYAQAYEYNSTLGSGLNRPLESSLKDKDGNTVTKKAFEYDARGNLAKESIFVTMDDGRGMIEEIISTAYSYDPYGNLETTINAKDAKVTTEYEDTFYTYPKKVTNSLGHTITYEYEPRFGVVTKVTDANGVSSSTEYDSLGRVIQGMRDDGGGTQITTVTYTYPDFNTKLATNSIELSSTTYIDGLGRNYKIISQGEDGDSPKQIITETFYNQRGFVDRESLPHYIDEPEENITYTRYKYDIRGRITQTISDFSPSENIPTDNYTESPADATVTIEYSPNTSNPLYTETTDPQGRKKGALKDIYGNIIEVKEFIHGDPEAKADGAFHTYYEYDIQNNLTKTTDNKGNFTQIFYDSIGRKLKMLDPDMGTWSYEYDILGNLITQTDAKGQVLTFEYDSLNRLVKKSSLRAPSEARDEAISEYFYDDPDKPNCIGRLSKVTDQSGSTEFFYDRLGREIKSTKSLRGASPQAGDEAISYTVQREYDILDRLTKLTYPDGEAVEYAYDKNSGLLESVSSLRGSEGAEAIPYAHDIYYSATGQIRSISYGNGVTTIYTYGQDLRLNNIYTAKGQGDLPLQNLNYTFDENGNITRIVTERSLSNPTAAIFRDYTYDTIDRLTEVRKDSSLEFYYEYNSIGNMTRKSDVGPMIYGSTALTTGGQGAGPHALTNAAGYTYKYDANGNMTQGKNKALEYDVENRLTKVDELGTITTFAYDGDGGRVRKTMSLRGSEAAEAISTTYIGSLYEEEVKAEGSRVYTKHIFAGANRIATISNESASSEVAAGFSLRYYHSDHLGSSSIITDQAGNQIQHLEYTPYGTIAQNEGTDIAKHKFTGKELDSTGLYFYGARYYDPEIGRFITADPTIQRPYDPQDLNRYTYCRNNPINYTDPTGHSWKSFWKKFGTTIASVLGVILAPFTGGLSLYLTYAATIYSGVQAAQAGQFGAWAAGFAISMALGFAIPVGDFGNLGMQIGVSTLRGAAIGAIAGGIASVVGGGSFGAGALQGAIGGAQGGALSGFMTSQQFQNWKAGNGFRSNAAVQAEQRQLGKLQEMLDEARAQEVADKIMTQRMQDPDMLMGGWPEWLGTAGRIAEASGYKGVAKALTITGRVFSTTGPWKLAGGIVGGKIGFGLGGQWGAQIGFRVGLFLGGPGGAVAGAMTGYGIGAVAGGFAGGTLLGSLTERLDRQGIGQLNYEENVQ